MTIHVSTTKHRLIGDGLDTRIERGRQILRRPLPPARNQALSHAAYEFTVASEIMAHDIDECYQRDVIARPQVLQRAEDA